MRLNPSTERPKSRKAPSRSRRETARPRWLTWARAPTLMLECDVTLSAEGCAGFAFGGSEADEAWTALCLDAERNLIHYEGYELTELSDYPPMAVTRFDFSENRTHHVTLVCENEIVVMYIDDEKALSSRIGHSTDGAHIGVFSESCDAAFSGITMKVPE